MINCDSGGDKAIAKSWVGDSFFGLAYISEEFGGISIPWAINS